MPDRFALPALALLAIGLVALALVWPRGQGAPSPAPETLRGPVASAHA